MKKGNPILALLAGLCILCCSIATVACAEGQPFSYITFGDVQEWFREWNPEVVWESDRVFYMEFEGYQGQFNGSLAPDFRKLYRLSFSCREDQEQAVKVLRSISETLGDEFPEAYYQAILDENDDAAFQSASGLIWLYSSGSYFSLYFDEMPEELLPTLDRIISAVIRSGLTLKWVDVDQPFSTEWTDSPYTVSIYLESDGTLRQFTVGYRMFDDEDNEREGLKEDAPRYFESVIDLLTTDSVRTALSDSLKEHFEPVLLGDEDRMSEFSGGMHSSLENDGYQMRFNVLCDQDPDDAVSFTGEVFDIPAYRQFVGVDADSPLVQAASLEETEQVMQAAAQAKADAHAQEIAQAFEGIEQVQIEPTVIIDQNGLKITLEGLVYGENDSQQPAIAAIYQIDKEEGAYLDALSVSASLVNRYSCYVFGRVNLPGQATTDEVHAELTAWSTLSAIQDAIPDFAGFSSLRFHASGKTTDGERFESGDIDLSTGLPEAPLPGKKLFEYNGISLTLYGGMEERSGFYTWKIYGENNTDEEVFLTNNLVRFNQLDMRSTTIMGMFLDPHSRQTEYLSIAPLDLPDGSLDHLNTLEFGPYVSCASFEGVLDPVMLTAEDLGLAVSDRPASEYAEEFPEQVIAEMAGLRLRLIQMAEDGKTLIFHLENETDETMAAALKNVSINGWQLDDTFQIFGAPGDNGRTAVDLSEHVPNFTGYAQISFDVHFYAYRENAEWGGMRMLESISDEETHVSLVPAHPVTPVYDDAGQVLMDQGGVRVIYTGETTTGNDALRFTILVINDTDKEIRLTDLNDPLRGTSGSSELINGQKADRSYLPGTHVKAHQRYYDHFTLFLSTLSDLGLTPETVETLEGTLSFFPDNYGKAYEKVPFLLHASLDGLSAEELRPLSSSGGTPAAGAAEELTVTAENNQTVVTAEKKLKLTAAFPAGSSASAKDQKKGFTWAVLDPATGAASSLAKVASNGILSAGKKIAAPTEVEVRATAKATGASGSIRITLMPAVSKVTVAPDTLTFYVGEDRAAEVRVSFTPDTVPVQNLSWQAKPLNIVEIAEEQEGATIRPLAKGKTVITVKEPGGRTAKVTVNVLTPVESLELTAKGKAKAGGKVTLTAALQPKQAGDKTVTWAIDVPEDIATISAKGVLSISKTAPAGTVITVICTATGAPEPVVKTMEITVE